MLKSLGYSVEFPTTGRSFSNQITFAPGLTAITGRNESGKTLIVEMIGYCLFGKDALRGAAADYKNLVANLTFDLMGAEVVIDRAKKETMTVDGEVVAVGAAAINKEVPQRLGFGLDVFNVACASQQGDIGKLTEMRPTARLAMIDRLTGLDQLESVEKKCKDEAKTQTAMAQGMILSVKEPVAPVQPDDYEVSLNLDVLVREIEEHQRKRDQFLRVSAPTEPTAPTAPEHTDVEELEAYEENRQAILREKAHVDGQLAAIPGISVTREELQKALDWKAFTDEEARRGPRPIYQRDQLAGWEAVHSLLDRAKRGESVGCPKCAHEFVVSDPDLDLAHVHALEQPPLTLREITAEYRRHELWAEPLAHVERYEIKNIQQEINAHARADQRADLARRSGELVVPADRAGDLRAARSYRADLAVFSERLSRYREQLSEYEAAQAALAGLADRSDELVALRQRAASARHYESLRAQFEREEAHYRDVVARVRDAREAAEGFERGASALRSTRSRVKQELAPCLSLAASSLLSSMTSGERRRIDIDHEFNIVVDGQPLATLSGSGKSVVNLALRLGLGQVLTAKVLPIFIGDEIDKDMDQERATSTHSTMETLRQYLTQILIVTHKEVEADQVLSL